MLTDMDVTEAGDGTMKILAARLKPHLVAKPFLTQPAGAGPVTVTVARMNKNQSGGNVMAWCDLTFSVGGVELHTVKGFRLMQKEDKSRWLSVPNVKKEVIDRDTLETKATYEDTFKFGSNDQKEQARRAVQDAFEPAKKDDIEFGERA